MAAPALFTRTLERSESRLMIRSVCAGCGESKLVSKHDGSLQDWEVGHRCQPSAMEKKGPASATVREELRIPKIGGGKPGRNPHDAS